MSEMEQERNVLAGVPIGIAVSASSVAYTVIRSLLQSWFRGRSCLSSEEMQCYQTLCEKYQEIFGVRRPPVFWELDEKNRPKYEGWMDAAQGEELNSKDDGLVLQLSNELSDEIRKFLSQREDGLGTKLNVIQKMYWGEMLSWSIGHLRTFQLNHAGLEAHFKARLRYHEELCGMLSLNLFSNKRLDVFSNKDMRPKIYSGMFSSLLRIQFSRICEEREQTSAVEQLVQLSNQLQTLSRAVGVLVYCCRRISVSEPKVSVAFYWPKDHKLYASFSRQRTLEENAILSTCSGQTARLIFSYTEMGSLAPKRMVMLKELHKHWVYEKLEHNGLSKADYPEWLTPEDCREYERYFEEVVYFLLQLMSLHQYLLRPAKELLYVGGEFWAFHMGKGCQAVRILFFVLKHQVEKIQKHLESLSYLMLKDQGVNSERKQAILNSFRGNLATINKTCESIFSTLNGLEMQLQKFPGKIKKCEEKLRDFYAQCEEVASFFGLSSKLLSSTKEDSFGVKRISSLGVMVEELKTEGFMSGSDGIASSASGGGVASRSKDVLAGFQETEDLKYEEEMSKDEKVSSVDLKKEPGSFYKDLPQRFLIKRDDVQVNEAYRKVLDGLQEITAKLRQLIESQAGGGFRGWLHSAEAPIARRHVKSMEGVESLHRKGFGYRLKDLKLFLEALRKAQVSRICFPDAYTLMGDLISGIDKYDDLIFEPEDANLRVDFSDFDQMSETQIVETVNCKLDVVNHGIKRLVEDRVKAVIEDAKLAQGEENRVLKREIVSLKEQVAALRVKDSAREEKERVRDKQMAGFLRAVSNKGPIHEIREIVEESGKHEARRTRLTFFSCCSAASADSPRFVERAALSPAAESGFPHEHS